MSEQIFAFTLMTKNDKFDKADCIFSTDGDVIGRILKKSKIY